ncbi:hypothetical protein PGT21_007649 [Puccinia graminis f. sp. tritici]|nr:hypothetical protein PGT21_007649 [Puccinia graminis f. sp. tritici]
MPSYQRTWKLLPNSLACSQMGKYITAADTDGSNSNFCKTVGTARSITTSRPAAFRNMKPQLIVTNRMSLACFITPAILMQMGLKETMHAWSGSPIYNC